MKRLTTTTTTKNTGFAFELVTIIYIFDPDNPELVIA